MFPDLEILEAFGVHGEPVALAGGRGLCYAVGDVVLRPSEDDAECQWIADLASKLPQSSSYRVARPRHVVGKPETFVYQGWTASSFLHGHITAHPDFKQILTVCRSFHKDLKALDLGKPDFLTQQSNRWREADSVTWDEKRLDDIENVNFELLADFQPMLQRLKDMMKTLPTMDKQVIHGDLTGNVLFHDKEPPGIIDMTPYWRPPAYAEAIVVADALSWYEEGRDLVLAYGVDKIKLQLLLRALYWRYLTFVIDTDLDWVKANISKSDHNQAVDIVCDFVNNM